MSSIIFVQVFVRRCTDIPLGNSFVTTNLFIHFIKKTLYNNLFFKFPSLTQSKLPKMIFPLISYIIKLYYEKFLYDYTFLSVDYADYTSGRG